MSKEWQIPVSWEMCGVVCITADTLEEAIDLANNDDSVGLPTGNYVDASFAVSFDNPDAIRALYNNDQPDEVNVRQAIRDFMEFEEETSILYPFASAFQELSEDSLLAIEAKCSGNTDTETLYDAIEAVVGVNPKLKDTDLITKAFMDYQKTQEKVPLTEQIKSAEKSCDLHPSSDVKERNAEHRR